MNENSSQQNMYVLLFVCVFPFHHRFHFFRTQLLKPASPPFLPDFFLFCVSFNCRSKGSNYLCLFTMSIVTRKEVILIFILFCLLSFKSPEFSFFAYSVHFCQIGSNSPFFSAILRCLRR